MDRLSLARALAVVGLVAVVVGGVGLVAASARPGPILSIVTGSLSPVSPRPAQSLLEVAGQGGLREPLELTGGLYGFRWLATAGDADCTFELVLEGSDGPIVLDDYGRIDGGHSASATTRDAQLEAGRTTLVAATDCPGDSRLWAWRYLE